MIVTLVRNVRVEVVLKGDNHDSSTGYDCICNPLLLDAGGCRGSRGDAERMGLEVK